MITQRINSLRSLFNRYQIDGYLIPIGDEYLSEYTADYAKRLEYISGFTGSNGLAVIFKEAAYFFTDGRYIEQSHKQLDTTLFQIHDLKELKEILGSEKRVIGYDYALFTLKQLKSFEFFQLTPLADNLIDQIWENKPNRPAGDIYIYPIEYAGNDYLNKIAVCREYLNQHQASFIVLTKADTISWLFNIRGNDIPFSPMVLGVAVISQTNAYLFTAIRNSIPYQERSKVQFHNIDELPNVLSQIDEKVLVDEENTNSYIISLIKNRQHAGDPCALPKACKNDIEIKGFIQGHIYDAVAICEFFSSLEFVKLEELTECDLAQQLTNIRSKQPLYIMDSFPTICGFQGNGSIIHYNPANSVPKKIQGDGLLLIDSGAHYMGATTDITRVIAIGKVTQDQKNYYTKVLKGHIALANIKFPKGTTGSNLDVLARQFLWEDGDDYAHGTGHGVGAALSVHEGPQNINLRNTVSLQKGMVLSNEPGFYKPGEYGIRIENLMYVDDAPYHGYLQFQTLSLVPYEKELINFDLLTKSELDYIKNYYLQIHDNIYHLLSERAKKWLKGQTRHL